jgi:adenylosuccinate lyase
MSIRSLSPLDGRYQKQTAGLGEWLSEWALIRHRVQVEIEWLVWMSQRPEITCVRAFSNTERALLRSWTTGFGDREAARVKQIEALTRHDVKAVEYYLRERLQQTPLADMAEFVHFCCTSEDINNLAYGLMLKAAIEQEWLPTARRLVNAVSSLADAHRDRAMLSRTHGQPASPTTLGKELAVFVYRWQRQLAQLRGIEYLGKFNGTVGSYNTHATAYPEAPWLEITRGFVERLGLTFNPLTTQIEPHDWMSELFHLLIRFNTITLDFDRDMWTYISRGYFRQRVVPEEVGSSTMPHKVNPIDFENSEANLGISSALLEHLAAKLPVSRLQRDLTDSSALRNAGTAIGHSLVALHSTLRGLESLEIHEAALERDLDQAWEVLAEAVQIVMRKNGCPGAYEQLKALTRGAEVSREEIRAFIVGLEISGPEKDRLLALTPASYTGLAAKLPDAAIGEFE